MKRYFLSVFFLVILFSQLVFASFNYVCVIRADSLGDTVWTRCIDTGETTFQRTGLNEAISFEGVKETIEGGCIVTWRRYIRGYSTWRERYSTKLDKNGFPIWWLEIQKGDMQYEWRVTYEFTTGLTINKKKGLFGRIITDTLNTYYNASTCSNFTNKPVEGIVKLVYDTLSKSPLSPPNPPKLVFERADVEKLYQKTSDGGSIEISGRHNWWSGDAVQKTDDCGEVVWEREYPFDLYSIRETADGCYILAGSETHTVRKSSKTYRQAVLIKLASSGEILWTKTLSREKRQFGWAGTAIELNEGRGYMVLCRIEEDLVLYKTNTAGEVLWEHTYKSSFGSPLYPLNPFLVETTDGGYIIAARNSL